MSIRSTACMFIILTTFLSGMGTFPAQAQFGGEIELCGIDTSRADKIDVVFIPMGFTDEWEFVNLAREHADFASQYKGILYYEPFKSSARLFAFWRTALPPAYLEASFLNNACRYADRAFCV